MRSVKSELLATLCRRINEETAAILDDETLAPHDKYLSVYQHIQESDAIVAECFDNWRRSTLMLRLLALAKHDLLTDEQLARLSDRTRGTLHFLMTGEA